MNDFVDLGFELAFKYRNPVMILSDGVIGQMMEKVELSDYKPRMTDEFIAKEYGSWAATGKPKSRERNIVTSLELDPARQEKFNEKLQKKYAEIREKEARFENFKTEDAEYLIVAYGSSSRISKKSVELLRAKGIKVGLLRPITLFPFPEKELLRLSKQIKGILTVEMSAGQMIEDVKLAVNCSVPVKHYGRFGGMIPSPDDIVTALEQQIIGGK
jgi:2-oxoglutarate ferredoxin oxidoreductase subunit alpha